jgi:Zn-dependent protease
MSKSYFKNKREPHLKINISSGFLLLMAIIYFFDSCGIFLAALPALIVHEGGHILAMRLFGARPTALRAGISGFALDFSGDISCHGEFLTTLSGPFFGLCFAFLCARLAVIFESEYLLSCAGIGLILNCFNLLPALPLDGGRAVSIGAAFFWGNKVSKVISLVLSFGISLALCLFGLYFLLDGKGAALLIAGIWLLVFPKRLVNKDRTV